jgi:hypothetical protein
MSGWLCSCIIATYGVPISEREEEEMTRWYFYHRRKIGYVYESTKSYKVLLLLGSMFS